MTFLKNRLKRHEIYRSEPYRDDQGHWTIGYGHCMVGKCHVSKEVADLILDEDIHQATFEYLSLGWQLDKNREDVCREMIFWHGLTGFLNFKKCVAAIEAEDWDRAADEMMDSQSGRRYTERMEELAEIMRSGRA